MQAIQPRAPAKSSNVPVRRGLYVERRLAARAAATRRSSARLTRHRSPLIAIASRSGALAPTPPAGLLARTAALGRCRATCAPPQSRIPWAIAVVAASQTRASVPMRRRERSARRKRQPPPRNRSSMLRSGPPRFPLIPPSQWEVFFCPLRFPTTSARRHLEKSRREKSCASVWKWVVFFCPLRFPTTSARQASGKIASRKIVCSFHMPLL